MVIHAFNLIQSCCVYEAFSSGEMFTVVFLSTAPLFEEAVFGGFLRRLCLWDLGCLRNQLALTPEKTPWKDLCWYTCLTPQMFGDIQKASSRARGVKHGMIWIGIALTYGFVICQTWSSSWCRTRFAKLGKLTKTKNHVIFSKKPKPLRTSKTIKNSKESFRWLKSVRKRMQAFCFF